MRVRGQLWVLVAGMMLARAAGGAEVVISREDLSDTKLPHGELLLPTPGSVEGRNGYLLRFSDGKLGMLPVREEGKTTGDLLEKMRSEKTGDLLYTARSGGSFLVLSGKGGDLGMRYLYEVADVELPMPVEIVSKEGEMTGTVEGIKEGSVYLLGTTDGKYALVRILRKQANGVLIQYVYQPEGGRKFAIPRGVVVSLPASTQPTEEGTGTVSAAAPVAAVRPPTTLTLTPRPSGTEIVLVPYLEHHLRERAAVIEVRVKAIRGEARNERQVMAKADAMDDLRQLRAYEAVDVLLEEISFFNPQAKMKRYSIAAVHPAVAALREIGKPASVGALKAISALKTGEGEATDSFHTPEYRLRLLTLVVKGVEGADVTAFLLKREMEKADASHRSLYEEALKYLQEPDND